MGSYYVSTGAVSVGRIAKREREKGGLREAQKTKTKIHKALKEESAFMGKKKLFFGKKDETFQKKRAFFLKTETLLDGAFVGCGELSFFDDHVNAGVDVLEDVVLEE